jgi:alpha-glucosidase (family GH31 glycosyl hydrolase)
VYHSFSPRDVVFSGWVGDQDPTFDGLQNALMNIFHSAWRNYVNFGSDIGSSSSSASPGLMSPSSSSSVMCVHLRAHACE